MVAGNKLPLSDTIYIKVFIKYIKYKVFILYDY